MTQRSHLPGLDFSKLKVLIVVPLDAHYYFATDLWTIQRPNNKMYFIHFIRKSQCFSGVVDTATIQRGKKQLTSFFLTYLTAEEKPYYVHPVSHSALSTNVQSVLMEDNIEKHLFTTFLFVTSCSKCC